MPEIEIKYVVSFSSQDKLCRVSNLLTGGKDARWLSNPSDRSGQLEAVFQLEKPYTISFIDVGVIWASSIEVRVGKSDWPQNQPFIPLVPSSVLMSAQDALLRRNTTRTCMFGKDNFLLEAGKGEWDRVQVLCRQVWKKDVQMGLSFLRLTSTASKSVDNNISPVSGDLLSKANKPSAVKQSVADIQRHFFGNKLSVKSDDERLKQRLQMISASSEGGTDNPEALPRVARMLLEGKQHTSCKEAPALGSESCQRLYSNTLRQKHCVEFHVEVADFLHSQNIKKDDVNSLKVSDLRHKFEKQKFRKLTQEEKHIFLECCQDFISLLFEDDFDDAPDVAVSESCSSTPSNNTSSLTVGKQTASLANKSAHPLALHSSLCPDQNKKPKKKDTGFTEPKSSTLDRNSASDNASKCFLFNKKNVFQHSVYGLSKPTLTLNKTVDVVTGEKEVPVLNAHVNPQCVVKKQPFSHAKGAKSPAIVAIDKDLLKSCKQFSICRSANFASSESLNSFSPIGSPVISKNICSPLNTESMSKAESSLKRKMLSLTPSDETTPAKRASASLVLPEANSPWLSARRGGLGSVNEGQIRGRGQRGRGKERGRGRQRGRQSCAQSVEERDMKDMSPGIVKGCSARGSGVRGRGRGASRRLEMASSPATPDSSTFSSTSYGLHSPSDGVFVECPLCGEMFPSDRVSSHASGCHHARSVTAEEASRNAVSSFVQCPLCDDMFPSELITQHASSCSL